MVKVFVLKKKKMLIKLVPETKKFFFWTVFQLKKKKQLKYKKLQNDGQQMVSLLMGKLVLLHPMSIEMLYFFLILYFEKNNKKI